MYASQLQAALASIHHRWEHGHAGLTVGCVLCADEQAEVRALTAADAALAPRMHAAPFQPYQPTTAARSRT